MRKDIILLRKGIITYRGRSGRLGPPGGWLATLFVSSDRQHQPRVSPAVRRLLLVPVFREPFREGIRYCQQLGLDLFHGVERQSPIPARRREKSLAGIGEPYRDNSPVSEAMLEIIALKFRPNFAWKVFAEKRYNIGRFCSIYWC
jgi:hypothetical protein